MPYRLDYDLRSRKPGGTLQRVLGVAGLVAIVSISAVIGLAFFALFLALAAVLAAVTGARLWWLRRRLGTAAFQTGRSRPDEEGVIIETEYTVIDRGERD